MARAFEHKGQLLFWCPGCNGMKSIDAKRWNWDGNLDEPTLSPSILQKVGPFQDGHTDVCHSFVTKGRISYCADCTHAMAGHEYDLPDLVTVVDDLGVTAEGNLEWRRKESGCPKCNGTGIMEGDQSAPPGSIRRLDVPCPECNPRRS